MLKIDWVVKPFLKATVFITEVDVNNTCDDYNSMNHIFRDQ